VSTSKLQIFTGSELRHRFAKYGIVENTRPDWLVSTKGERLELDFYLERLGIAVEVQGKQHFEFVPIFHTSEWGFREQVRRDREKLEICQRAGIDLLYVCKKSDIELVLTACYDALKPSGQDGDNFIRTYIPVTHWNDLPIQKVQIENRYPIMNALESYGKLAKCGRIKKKRQVEKMLAIYCLVEKKLNAGLILAHGPRLGLVRIEQFLKTEHLIEHNYRTEAADH